MEDSAAAPVEIVENEKTRARLAAINSVLERNLLEDAAAYLEGIDFGRRVAEA